MPSIKLYPCDWSPCGELLWRFGKPLLERLSFTFTSNGKREFVPRDQVSPLILVLFCSLLPRINFFYTQFLILRNCFEPCLSAHFLFWKILNLNLTFAVYVKLKLSITMEMYMGYQANQIYLYYTSTSEIPGKLWGKNIISSHVKTKGYLHRGRNHCWSVWLHYK